MPNPSNDGKTAILLLAHGTPDRLEEIPEYLSKVTGGRPMPQEVIAEISHRYGLIGRSPLTDITLAQARLLSESIGMPVYTGMRNWKPYIGDTISQMAKDGISRAVAICMAPQNSRTSVGLYRRAAFSAAGDSLAISFVDAWNVHPRLVEAFSSRLKRAMAKVRAEIGQGANSPIPVLFTAHSVPCRTVQGAEPDPYANQAKETAYAVAQACGLSDADW